MPLVHARAQSPDRARSRHRDRRARDVVEENIDDVEPYFALGAMFRSRGEHERAIRVHQALALRERDQPQGPSARALRARPRFPRRRHAAPRDQARWRRCCSTSPGTRVRCARSRRSTRSRRGSTRRRACGSGSARRRDEDTSHARAPPAGRRRAGRARRVTSLDAAKQLLKAAQKLAETRRTSSPRPPSSPPRATTIAAARTGSSRRCSPIPRSRRTCCRG